MLNTGGVCHCKRLKIACAQNLIAEIVGCKKLFVVAKSVGC